MNTVYARIRRDNRAVRRPAVLWVLSGLFAPDLASAGLSMSVDTNEASASLMLDGPGASIMHGDAVGGTASVSPGGHPCLPNVGTDCLTGLTPPIGFAAAEMDAGTGHFQMYAGESGGGSGSTSMTLTDAISRPGLPGVGTVTFDIHIDLSLFASLNDAAGAAAYSDFDYSILGRSCDGDICDYTQPLFNFSASRHATRDAGNNVNNDAYFSWSDSMGGGESGSGVPAVFETAFSIPFLFGNGVPPLEFALAISGGGGCDFGSNCGSAYVSSVNSAYLGIRVNGDYDYTSANGYGYVGYPSAVPVPAAAWLFGSGLIGMMGVARRAKPR